MIKYNFRIENLELYFSLIATILGLLITTTTFLLKFIKSAKGKKVALNLIKISDMLLPIIEEAETFVNYTGTEKKAYVTTRIKEYAINNKIKMDSKTKDFNILLDEKIEEIVSLTKQVNYPVSSNKDTAKILKKLREDK